MRYAIFSDIHGNLQALRSVLERIDELKVDRRICLGDIVGYGGNPNECVEEVRRAADVTIAGNHDHAALGLTDVTYFNSNAKTAILWTQGVLSEERRRFLTDLPLTVTEGPLLFVHSSPNEPDHWHYVLNPDAAEIAFAHFQEEACFIGHSHRPLVAGKREGERSTLAILDEVKLEAGVRYVINEGSVGQPRDADPRACFLVLDTDKRAAKIERVEYDIGGAQRAILKAGLPPALAERLANGW